MKGAIETINTKQLRTGLGSIIERVRRGASFLVLHRSRPAFQIVPPTDRPGSLPSLESDPIYRAGALGQSKDGLACSRSRSSVLYRRMKSLFVDTAGWIACADAADPDHEVACGARDNWLEHQGLLITSDYVIDETLTLLRLRLGLSAAERMVACHRRHPNASFENLIHEERAERARHIFFRHRDKNFSFTDCTSFALMRELRIREALTTDKHFRQAGFQMSPSG